MTLTHSLDRTVLIGATRETVFRFFTDNARWAAWWGAGSTIDPKPGGAVRIGTPTRRKWPAKSSRYRGPIDSSSRTGLSVANPFRPGRLA